MRLRGVAGSTDTFGVQVSGNSRFLTDLNGKPLLLMGDGTSQTLVQQPLATMDQFLALRVASGFNAFWMHVLVNSQDLGNANGATYDGIEPFTGTLDGTTVDSGPNYDVTTPNPLYFARLLAILTLCANAGMLVFLDNMENDSYLQVYENNGDTRMAAFGTYLANLVKSYTNIVHMTGNDFQTWNTSSTDNQLAKDLMSSIAAADPVKLQTVELNYNM